MGVADPVPLFELFSANAVSLGELGRAKGPARWLNALAHRLRDNKPQQAKANIAAHYDLGNDFYSAWLDDTMTYSSALWMRDSALSDAQRNKIDQLLDRLKIRKARACWRSAAAGEGLPSKQHGAARTSSASPSRPSRRPGPSARSSEATSPTASRSACRTIATSRSSSMPSPRWKWSRPSAGAGGAPISIASPAT